MADDEFDDDFFEDDTFDLPEHELRALEETARSNSRESQHQTSVQPQPTFERLDPQQPYRQQQGHRAPQSYAPYRPYSSTASQEDPDVKDAPSYAHQPAYPSRPQHQQQLPRQPQQQQPRFQPPPQRGVQSNGRGRQYQAPRNNNAIKQNPLAPPPLPQQRSYPTKPAYKQEQPQAYQQHSASNPQLPQQQQFSQQYGADDSTLPTLPLETNTNTATIGRQTVPTLEDPSSDYGDLEGFEETAELWDAVAPAVIQQNGDSTEVLEYPAGNATVDIYQLGQAEQSDDQQAYEQAQAYRGMEDQDDGLDDAVMIDAVPPLHQLRDYAAEIAEREDRLAELQQEKELLAQQLAEARTLERSKTGEVAIVRKNLNNKTQEHARQLESLQKLQAEERAKHAAEIENMKVEIAKARTENMFLQQEADESAKRSKVLESDVKKGRRPPPSVGSQRASQSLGMEMVIHGPSSSRLSKKPSTPKKSHKGYGLRDGFDDDEIMFGASSPIKQRTPTKPGTKRKRSSQESPIPELPLSVPRDPTPQLQENTLVEDLLFEKLMVVDDSSDLFDAIMAHNAVGTNERPAYSLAKFSYPSSKHTNLSTIFLDQLRLLRATAKSEFSTGVCKFLVSMWSRCFEEQYFDALSSLLELLEFAMLWNQAHTCSEYLDELLTLVQQTVDINAIPMLDEKYEDMKADIDVRKCLEILEHVALAVLNDEEHAERFWRLMRADFPLILIKPCQPLEHAHLMVRILSTSVFESTFGPITSNDTVQRTGQSNLLSALSKLLITAPETHEHLPPYSRLDLLELRIQVVQFWGALATVGPGVEALAASPYVIPRLIRLIAEEIDQLYDWHPDEEERTEFLNGAVRLLHGIVAAQPEHARPKLGGPVHHRNLISMARLGFSSLHRQDKGIDYEVASYAQELLDLVVSPEEAEQVHQLFPDSRIQEEEDSEDDS